MARRDITIYSESGFGFPGSKTVNVAAGATAILSGEPVAQALGGTTGTQAATSTPVVGTDFLAGIATSDSTQTASAAGIVHVLPTTGITFLIAPKTLTLWDTQAEYDALVGKRLTLDLTAGVFTVNATDGATFGLVVEPLDITKYPGKVRFSVRAAASVLA